VDIASLFLDLGVSSTFQSIGHLYQFGQVSAIGVIRVFPDTGRRTIHALSSHWGSASELEAVGVADDLGVTSCCKKP